VSDSLPRILIVYNQPVLPAGHPDALSEVDIIETVDEVEKVLPASDFVVERFGYARRPQLLLSKLEDWMPDTVFNLFEGEADRTATEVYHAALLEWMRVPFTGSPAAALSLCRDKIRTKYLLQGAGISTPAFQIVESTPRTWAHGWPAIVKPATQDASVGIDQGSVVTSQSQLEARVAHVLERFGPPVLVEQYIPGREFHVHVFDDQRTGQSRVMPPGEIRFEAGGDYWPIYTYEGKWNEQSVEYKKTPLDTSVTLPGPLVERIDEICLATYRLLGMRDYGRVDVRVTPEGRPFVLEVNPNPYLNSIILVKGLERLGISFAEFVQNMTRAALGRKA
jgi:D-alanine-D-alanine ligase